VRTVLRGALISVVATGLMACAGNGPGPIEGTWAMTEPFPVTVTFRSGEVESMGTTKVVSYKTVGDEVFVTYKEGANKGSTFRYQVIDADTIRSESGTFQRVR
jgi:hypothetical protein